MPLIPIAIQLAAQFAPDLIAHLMGPNAGAVAEKVVGIAQQVTGQAQPDAALAAVKADPNVALAYQKAVLDQKVQLEQIAAQRAKDDADADNKADELLTDRMAKLEGTASDLKGVPILGPAMLFLRGSQRIGRARARRRGRSSRSGARRCAPRTSSLRASPGCRQAYPASVPGAAHSSSRTCRGVLVHPFSPKCYAARLILT
jgi:hypothetical protein